MSHGIRIVASFRPFPVESPIHRDLAAVSFDWIGAIRMLFQSCDLACHCPVHVLTDVDTDLPLPTLKYQTSHRRLMLWSLEVVLKFLESPDFDRDTVLLDCDQLVYQDLAPTFRRGIDYTVLIRTGAKHLGSGRVLLNGVQYFSWHARAKLIAFYRLALAVAEHYPERLLIWGADTEAVQDLLHPLEVGVAERHGLRVQLIESDTILQPLSSVQVAAVEQGRLQWPTHAVVDFRARRKRWMGEFYQATIGKAETVSV